jgi:glycine dehydrogenase
MSDRLATQIDPDTFPRRHLGPAPDEVAEMLAEIGYDSLDALVDAAIPESIRMDRALDMPPPRSEQEVLAEMRRLASRNRVFRSYIGMGYHGTVTPPVIQRTILENPAWYTAYTPYQAEIAQGRLEALLNFQTMVIDLTGMEIANASLLDEATAAAEAMAVTWGMQKRGEDRTRFFVSELCHPQTIDVVRTRAVARGWEVVVGDHDSVELSDGFFGALLQYPASDGVVIEYGAFCERAHAAGALVTAACDPLALALLTPPGEWGADIAVGSTQRFGVPMGYGGPHAAFMATREEFKRLVPGRIIGLSRDAQGEPALRMALQTREQHIRREKATSNICTAQVLLAVIASMYGVYHGPEGITRIARRVHKQTRRLHAALEALGYRVVHGSYFDTLRVDLGAREVETILVQARDHEINLRIIDPHTVGISLDETVTEEDLGDLVAVFARGAPEGAAVPTDDALQGDAIPGALRRTTPFMTHPVFHTHRSETEMLRYIRALEEKDLSLVHSMIPLGSCTMKLNAATEMLPVTWPEFASLHPFVPREQAKGYRALFDDLRADLAEITGFDAVSLQPNAGSQGEYAGLLAIQRYHQSRGEGHRDVCIIPQSAHGTNPASAVMAGMRVVPVKTDADGNIDVADLRARADAHAADLAALMITYPSTHGVFEETVREVCEIIHSHGGQVYLDGANLNAMVGLVRPGDIGADVCHLNLHKTFCIPHGGGGPGMGPIGVAAHLAPYLPGHPVVSPLADESRPGPQSVSTGAVAYRDDPQEGGDAEAIGNIAESRSHEDRSGQGGRGETTESYSGTSQVGSPKPNAGLDDPRATWAVSAAPWGSPSILPISWAYLKLMGGEGLTRATGIAVLNANYMARRLEDHFPVLYRGKHGLVAHECIIDTRGLRESGVTVEDIAKRLIDYGFHAPTVSWPVAGTLMIEPTESESRNELDRFCDALIAIRQEIAEIERGEADRQDNLLKNAPHTAAVVTADEWTHPYPRQQAAYPAEWLRQRKFWPPVGRVDSAYGDRNLVCACPPMEEYVS